jgi:CPA2 family monovalent cation:H+ antiporter-2
MPGKDQDTYIFNTREQFQLQEQLLTNDREVNPTLNDHTWDSNLVVNRFAEDGSEH